MEAEPYEEGEIEIRCNIAAFRRQHAEFVLSEGLHAIEDEKEGIGDALEGEKEHVASELLFHDTHAACTVHP